MCYWIVPDPGNPGAVAGAALAAARALVDSAKMYSAKMSAIFPGHSFNIGVGLSMGNALLGNVGTAMNQSITLVGDSVNIAFRLEALTKEKQQAILVTGNIAACAPANFLFVDLGQAEVKGRKKPVDVSALVPEDGAE